MKRNGLLHLLNQYSSTYPEEYAYKKRIIDFVEQNQGCFERSLDVGHITASSWLVNKNNSHAFLMHHAKLDIWVQPGGHCDGESDVLAVAIKEAQEESGILSIEPILSNIFDIDVHLIPENSREKQHYHYDIRFLLQVTSDEKAIANNESKAFIWVTKDKQVLPTKSVSIVRMFDKWAL